MLGALRYRAHQPRLWLRQTKLKRPLGGVGLVLAALALAAACGGDDDYSVGEPEPPTGTVSVSVEYPSARDESAVASVHVWVLQPGDDAGVSCARLVGGDDDPYDVDLSQEADLVSTDTAAGFTDDEVLVGPVLVYVEAVDFRGQVQLAGCTEGQVTETGELELTVSLDTAGVYDCGDPDAYDGAPCDDGEFCTVGETCDNGDCQGESPRSCDHLSAACLRGACDEDQGCVTQPRNEGDACSSGLPCLDNEICVAGECVGEARDCSQAVGPCELSLGCDEFTDSCVTSYLPYGTTCDDSSVCTSADYCDGLGNCTAGTAVDCSSLTDQCNTGVCNATSGACEAVPVANGTVCSDGLTCTTGDTCDGAGTCVGGAAPDCSAYNLDTCNVGVCVEGIGCQYGYAPNTTDCEDNNACTTVSRCDGAGSCAGVGFAPVGTECGVVGSCYGCNASGVCTAATATLGTVCDDLSVCTTADQCNASGVCAGTPEPLGTLCGTSPSDCFTTCDAAGTCGSAQAPDGTLCDDGDSLTTGDQCTVGVCAGT